MTTATCAPSRDTWVTTYQLADELEVHHATVRRWIATGQLPARHKGKRLLITRASVEAFKKAYLAPVVPRAPMPPAFPATGRVTEK